MLPPAAEKSRTDAPSENIIEEVPPMSPKVNAPSAFASFATVKANQSTSPDVIPPVMISVDTPEPNSPISKAKPIVLPNSPPPSTVSSKAAFAVPVAPRTHSAVVSTFIFMSSPYFCQHCSWLCAPKSTRSVSLISLVSYENSSALSDCGRITYVYCTDNKGGVKGNWTKSMVFLGIAPPPNKGVERWANWVSQ